MNNHDKIQSGISVKNILPPPQRTALESLAKRYNTEVNWNLVCIGGSGLPDDWIICQVGPIVVGVSPSGQISS
jgi:hypothetical protein